MYYHFNQILGINLELFGSVFVFEAAVGLAPSAASCARLPADPTASLRGHMARTCSAVGRVILCRTVFWVLLPVSYKEY